MAKAKKAAPKKAAPKQETSKPALKSVGNTPAAVFNIDEITDLLQAVKKSNVSELNLERGDVKITIKQGLTETMMMSAPAPVMVSAPVVQAPAPAPAAAAPVAPAAAPAPVADNLITIKSPMIGTFYRSSGPGKPVFVNVGDEIKEGQVLCIVEAMKLFNEIESEFSGKIVKVLVDDASPVEYDQPLFLVEP
jgi:acetyl-CoA carboxylase biotin carboxyl carrier protein